MMFKDFIHKIQRKLMKMRLQPIRVFCFHQVSDKFDPSTMWECDWMQTEQFKRNIMKIKEEYTFISLSEAYEKLQHDIFRCKKYAVLTADDGWASLKNIIPWLALQRIPITLFVNSAYLDGKHYQERETEKLLTMEDVVDIVNRYPQYVTIASHGETHINTQQLSASDFEMNVTKAESVLEKIPNKVSFYAFTYGKYKYEHLAILVEHNLVPVLMDGAMNSNNSIISRESIDGIIENNECHD